MTSSNVIALGSTFVAIAALALTAYLARLNLEHQRREAHRARVEAHQARVWERKTDILLEFLEWLETDAVAKPQGGRGDAFDRAPRLPVSLHVRLGTFTSDKFMKALAAGLLAIGEWRQTLAQLDEDKVSLAKVNAVRLEVDRHLNDMHVFVRNEVGLMPQVSEKVTPAFFAARQERRQATDN